jgi:Kef-type K+ transport system membrane component KefB
MSSFWIPAACGMALAPACALMGTIAQKASLPQITGYLVAGVLMGPYVLGLLSQSSVSSLWMVDQACLSLIAFAAGAELHYEQLQSMKKQARFAIPSLYMLPSPLSVYDGLICGAANLRDYRTCAPVTTSHAASLA